MPRAVGVPPWRTLESDTSPKSATLALTVCDVHCSERGTTNQSSQRVPSVNDDDDDGVAVIAGPFFFLLPVHRVMSALLFPLFLFLAGSRFLPLLLLFPQKAARFRVSCRHVRGG